MTDKLTWDEIKRQYPDEWVILAQPEFNDNEDPVSGIVVSHGLDAAKALHPVRELKESLATLYTGEIHGGLISVRVESLD